MVILYVETNFLMSIAQGQDVARTLIDTENLQIKNDLIDNLILQCIWNHAKSHTTDNKVFLSGNKNDFGKPDVQEALSSSGIRYFTGTPDFLGWLQSQNS